VRRLNPERRLANRTVFLSASVPAPNRGFARPPDAAFVVEQAVVGLARAVFAEGGRLVFGAHPSISPLVASVATEYRQASAADGPRPVVIYQSRAFEEVLPNETWDLYRFGFADLLWTDAEGGEHYQPGDAASLQCPLSLRAMRTRMIKEQKPIAMVIAGGMDGVLEEFTLFREHAERSPIYAARDTGGAAARLLVEEGTAPRFHALEDEWLREGGSMGTRAELHDPRERFVPPWAAIMQWLVARLCAESSSEYADL
jgi:hypothetical protein